MKIVQDHPNHPHRYVAVHRFVTEFKLRKHLRAVLFDVSRLVFKLTNPNDQVRTQDTEQSEIETWYLRSEQIRRARYTSGQVVRTEIFQLLHHLGDVRQALEIALDQQVASKERWKATAKSFFASNGTHNTHNIRKHNARTYRRDDVPVQGGAEGTSQNEDCPQGT